MNAHAHLQINTTLPVTVSAHTQMCVSVYVFMEELGFGRDLFGKNHLKWSTN